MFRAHRGIGRNSKWSLIKCNETFFMCAYFYNGKWDQWQWHTKYLSEMFSFSLLIQSCLRCVSSGRRWAAMMRIWTPSAPTRCATSSMPIKTTGCAPSTFGGGGPSASMSRSSFQCETAAASLMSQARARRPSTSTTSSLTRTRPLKFTLHGWRTPGSRWTPSQPTRAFHRWTWVAGWWRSTLRCAASALCLAPASTWPFRTTEPACPSSLCGYFSESVPALSGMELSSQRLCQELRARHWWQPEGSAYPTEKKLMCQLNFTATEMASGWYLSAAACAKLDTRQPRMALSAKVSVSVSLFLSLSFEFNLFDVMGHSFWVFEDLMLCQVEKATHWRRFHKVTLCAPPHRIFWQLLVASWYIFKEY